MNDVTPLGSLEQAISLQNAGSPEEAKKIFLRIIALEPTNVAALYSLAVLLHNQHEADKALAYIEKAISLRGDIDYFYETKNSILSKIGNFEDAKHIDFQQRGNTPKTGKPDPYALNRTDEPAISLHINRDKAKTLSDVVSICDQLIQAGQAEKAIVLYRDYIKRA